MHTIYRITYCALLLAALFVLTPAFPRPQFPFAGLSDDVNGALDAIKHAGLKDFCKTVSGSGNNQNVNYNQNNGEKSYSINGADVPSELQTYQPAAIEDACGRYVSGGDHDMEERNDDEDEDEDANRFYYYFDKVFAGFGTDQPLHNRLIPGLPPAPYKEKADFSDYRQSCALAAANTAVADAFSVNTDFEEMRCEFVFGGKVDAKEDVREGGRAYLEVWNVWRV